MLDMRVFLKLHLSHPKSVSGVPYMNLDRIDESYPMVVSKLPFDQLA
jgi:hypothetical protein